MEEAEAVQEERMEAKSAGSNMLWKMESVCDACHAKSNRRQNEILLEKAGKGKPKNKRVAEIQKLLDALEACEKAGVVLSDEELAQLKSKMKELGIG